MDVQAVRFVHPLTPLVRLTPGRCPGVNNTHIIERKPHDLPRGHAAGLPELTLPGAVLRRVELTSTGVVWYPSTRHANPNSIPGWLETVVSTA